MVKTFKNGASLHRLLEAAPPSALSELLNTVEDGKLSAHISGLPWDGAADDAGIDKLRIQLLVAANAWPADLALAYRPQTFRSAGLDR